MACPLSVILSAHQARAGHTRWPRRNLGWGRPLLSFMHLAGRTLARPARFLVAPLLGMTGDRSPIEATSQDRPTGVPLALEGRGN